jgi:tetratricopeptide (TPR) repeat protein/KaiC/GvpD/RAD55 family RecA-like ATPase
MRTRVPTGYEKLDLALQGGFFAASAVVLSAPASNEVPIFLGNFLKSSADVENSLLICRSLSSADAVTTETDRVKVLVCGEPVAPTKRILPGKSVENLTELNFQINEILKTVQPSRVVLDIVSDVLLRHKALQTRKWLSELLAKLRARDVTTLAVLNPSMHPTEEVEAVVDIFDGDLEISERVVQGERQKVLGIRWMHGTEITEKEIPLAGLVSEPLSGSLPSIARPAIIEPRWLTPLINRSSEMMRLKTSLEEVLGGKATVVALQGEEGVGKTRLMQELGVYAQPKKSVVLSATSVEAGMPYGPWVELARQYVAQAPAEVLRRVLGGYASEFARLVPDIAAKLGTIPPSKPLGEQEDKIRLFEAVSQFFASISTEASLLLLFDDIHLIDQASLDLLEYFVRSTVSFRVLTLCSYPSNAISTQSPLYQVLMKFNKQRLLETIVVKNLDREETANLIKQIFGEQELSIEFSNLIYERTGGNPFFVEEVLRAMVEDGTIFRTEKGWDRKPIQEIVVPESVKTTLRSRLTKLSSEATSMLTIAAVIGADFDFEVLREVTQENDEPLLQKLESTIAQGLIVEVPHEKSRFRFADNRVRELLLDDLIQIRRARYHLRIAEAIEKVHSRNLERYAPSLAYHFTEGGDSERAIKYSISAGEASMAVHAYEPAIVTFRRSLDLIDLEGGKDKEKAAVLEKLGNCYAHNGQFHDSIQSYEQSLVLHDQLNDGRAYARACQGLAASIVTAKGYAGNREAIEVLKKGLKRLEDEPDSYDAATMYSLLSNYFGYIDEWDEATKWIRRAEEVGEKTQNYVAMTNAVGFRGSFLTDTGKIDDGLPLWQKAFELALQHELHDDAIVCLVNLAIYTYPRNLVKAREFGVRRLELCKKVNDISGVAGGLRYLAFLDWLRGDWTAAKDGIRQTLEIWDRLGLSRADSITNLVDVLLSLEMENLEKTERTAQRAIESIEESPKITDIVMGRLGLGIVLEAQQKWEDAERNYLQSVDAFRRWEFTSFPLLHIETLVRLASIQIRHGDLQRARENVQWAKRLAEELKSGAGLAIAYQSEALLSASTGDKEAAKATYQKCLELWEKAGWPYYRARAIIEFSDTLDKAAANEMLKSASQILSKLGATTTLERIQLKLNTRN